MSRIDPERCEPLAGALVDVWQCDAAGVYSGVEDIADRFDTTGKRFLRGHQVTDRGGIARFTTIYPGWYRGRTVHIHFKIRTNPSAGRGSPERGGESPVERPHARHPTARAAGHVEEVTGA